MKKTFPLSQEGKHPDRVLEAIKHEIRQYVRRERRRTLPEGVDFLDFDCRVGAAKESSEAAHLAALTWLVDAIAKTDAAQVYVEVVAKPGHRKARVESPPDAANVEGSI